MPIIHKGRDAMFFFLDMYKRMWGTDSLAQVAWCHHRHHPWPAPYPEHISKPDPYEKEACYTLAVLTSVLCMSLEKLISRLWRSAAAAASNKLHQISTRISTCSEQEAMSRAMCTQHSSPYRKTLKIMSWNCHTFQWQVPCIQFILGTPESVAPRSLVPSCKNCHHHTARAPTANWSIIITWLEFFLFHSLSWYWIDTGGHPNSEILCWSFFSWRGGKKKTCRYLNAQILSWSKISIEEKNESSMKSRKGCH